MEEVFGDVPKEAYLDSIRQDVENAVEEVLDNPVYILLNLCRVAACVEENLILSKQQGGEWGLVHLPEKYHPLIQDALDAYQSDAVMKPDAARAREFCGEMHDRIFPPAGSASLHRP